MPQILPARNVSPDVTGMRFLFGESLRVSRWLIFGTCEHKKTGAEAPVFDEPRGRGFNA
jgi:hypothetical protein